MSIYAQYATYDEARTVRVNGKTVARPYSFKGSKAKHKAAKRAQAEARNAQTPPERRAAYRRSGGPR
jgi:hypothetical protein